jgi:hypothetical protein
MLCVVEKFRMEDVYEGERGGYEGEKEGKWRTSGFISGTV